MLSRCKRLGFSFNLFRLSFTLHIETIEEKKWLGSPISPIFDRSSCLNGVVFAGGQIPGEPIFDFVCNSFDLSDFSDEFLWFVSAFTISISPKIRRREVRLQNHEKSGGNQFRFAFDIVMGEHDCSFLDWSFECSFLFSFALQVLGFDCSFLEWS